MPNTLINKNKKQLVVFVPQHQRNTSENSLSVISWINLIGKYYENT